MFDKDKVLDFVKLNGPVIPVQIAKAVGTDILFASAMLAELSSSKKIKVSKVKIGGSPLYYYPGQEIKLQAHSDRLNSKEKLAYDILMEQKVLRDKDQDPVIRVALREIKDFAIPLQVNIEGQREVFWKWYLMPDGEVEHHIRDLLHIKPPQKKIEAKPKEEIKENPKVIEPPKKIEKPVTKEKPKLKPEPVQKKIIQPKKKPLPKETNPEEFLQNTLAYFSKNKMKVIEQICIKKKTEYDFIINIESAIGPLMYYCKARSKKRISESDLNNAFLQSQSKRMPLLFLTQGELTKKAKELCEADLKGVSVKIM